MDRVIEDEPWNYVYFERDGSNFLTYLVKYGSVTVDFTVELTKSEVSKVSSGDFKISELINGFKVDVSSMESRFVKPPIWPNK